MLPNKVTLLPQLLSVIQNITNNHDPLLPNRLLTEAVDKGYILTSKQIKDILGIEPKGSSFTRCCFSYCMKLTPKLLQVGLAFIVIQLTT